MEKGYARYGEKKRGALPPVVYYHRWYYQICTGMKVAIYRWGVQKGGNEGLEWGILCFHQT